MDEITPTSDGEFEPADVICQNCNGEISQLKPPADKPKLFGVNFYVKWIYHCNTCGKQSKIFCSKLNK